MTRSNFTVEVSGTSGSHAGLWPEGEIFMLLPEGEHRAENALARVGLVKAGGPLSPDEAVFTSSPEPAGGPTTVTEVETRTARLARQDEEHPVLVLHDPDKQLVCSVHPDPLAKGEPQQFSVYDDHGEQLCHISRGRSTRSRRAYWRIDQPGGEPPLIGYKGTVAGWLGFALLTPLWLLFFAVSLLITLVTLGNTTELIVWSCPRRTAWRRPGTARAAITFRYMSSRYAWDDSLADHRIVHAQAAIHQFTKYRAEG
ncbi:hypothetical protein JGS22_024195 [Streptomyces sp. P38-E01]|uniref:Uncharacterized protein n=1 Tax=Streptomyces tardus TaxID=2780544 RepID=A0A949JJK1_9ACTN|nr:hypothetical protein [Streptomyces tardus]MBU7600642.1 hypothetical protein [Streptomyces tardus]